ncbi:radical SAM protein [Chloroflexi bacterium TSY]|nr:radical SAM protein [Chloroflexi bacterium TSY]
MNIQVKPDAVQKLSLLQDATRFEPAGSQPLPCISMVSTPTGQKPVLKTMLTTACERDCYYCPFRAGRSRTRRITFTPDEMASTFNQMHQKGLVDGLFLSSGIIKGSVTTQDKIIDTVEIIRRKYEYRGYVHLKVMPGAEREQLRRAMQLANRISVNLEGPTENRLQKLAPKKNFWNELIERIRWIGQLRNENPYHASVVTQFVVGAVGDTDLEILSLSENLYQQIGLRRTYYSAFRPVEQTPFENLTPTPFQREHRLYQSSFLLRDSVDPNLAFLAIFSRDCRDFGVIYSDFGYRKQPISYLKIAQI